MFRFGEFELDLDRYELRRGGEAVKAEPRVLEVLNYLIERRDRVVPKEELLDTLWADVHVSDSALTTAIRDARRALSDSPTDPRWIRTIYGRGLNLGEPLITVPVGGRLSRPGLSSAPMRGGRRSRTPRSPINVS